MLKPEMIAKLNEQITAEMYASNLYLQMSAWCEEQGLSGAAAFFRQHVPEELMHRDKFIDYLIECDAPVTVGAVAAPPTEFKNLVDVINKAFEHELKVTALINVMVEMALDFKDFNTFNMLQYFIAEQREEEVLFRGILDQVKLVAFKGETGEAMYLINQYLQRLATAPKR
jgi:ferritin